MSKLANIYLEVGKRIRLHRKANNYTQEDLGEMLQIDQSYVGRIERGEINITLDTLNKIADALQINPAELLESSKKGQNREQSEILTKIDTILYSLKSSELQIVLRLLKDIVSFKRV
ncbi:helix-turn-helix domain-containing protein [Paenibacillus glycanilyticus]|uniref:HTH cro/C1-type domain-containing protein n=1 Tax=Paenibacillus glycanilyticus TaxID=126569 RepID=A0ABQ6GMW9_9BACL|nr:helix-turn-helix transcriptional regulator [Paenibacillus glycanilyticus]GLX71425.1 hypothetical protein MU1_57750 [Paenibacillus glycanilyticus]